MMDHLQALSQAREKFPTSSLSKLTLKLTDTSAVHFIAFVSRIYNIRELVLEESSFQPLILFLSLPNLSFSQATLMLPSKGFPSKTAAVGHHNFLL